MQYYPFDSRNPIYKPVFSAAVEGETIKLRLLVHNDARCHSAFLRLKTDSSDSYYEYSMAPSNWLEEYRFWDVEIKLETGLYWYNFRYDSDYGEFFVTRCDRSIGHVSTEGADWQLTVCGADFETPEWLEGGIIYQIFPDRFAKSPHYSAEKSPNRYFCEDWSKVPEHRQNCGKCCLGNDFYSGNLRGITEKLPYLKSLGVNCIYLNPIFESASNHRYNTADYMKIDPVLGSEEDLKELCSTADKNGIKIILDGVFSHTGDDSVYFNKYGNYDSCGAFNSTESPYYSWYKFRNWPDDYGAWWGIKTLPEVLENDPGYTEFITGENGVIRHWMRFGISGWRLDVADELPDEFIEKIRRAVKAENPDGYLLGEVWEDASNKISYGKRRRYLLGKELDSVMNYPFSNAIIDFAINGNSQSLIDTVMRVFENYPRAAVKCMMNHIGTHDTARILTVLANGNSYIGDRDWQANKVFSESEIANAVSLLKIASVIQYTLPGVPSLYYGDEAGVMGFGDPFCRSAYPWGKENNDLIMHYTKLGNIRRTTDAFKDSDFYPWHCEHGFVSYSRLGENDGVFVTANVNDYSCSVGFPDEFKYYKTEFFGDCQFFGDYITLGPKSSVIIKYNKTPV